MTGPPFIYALVDPREPEHVRYVGMTASSRDGRSRPEYHRRYASPTNRTHSHLACWVRKLHRDGIAYQVVVLDRLCPGTPRELVGRREMAHIAHAKALGHCLVNATPGGDGGPTGLGMTRSVEARAAMSAAQKRVSKAIGRSERASEWSRRAWAAKSPEERAATGARLAAARKKGLRPFSEQHLARLSEVRKRAHEQGLYAGAHRDASGRFSK